MLGFSDAGWSSLAARRAHNPKVTGSNPVPATSFKRPGLARAGPLCLLRLYLRAMTICQNCPIIRANGGLPAAHSHAASSLNRQSYRRIARPRPQKNSTSRPLARQHQTILFVLPAASLMQALIFSCSPQPTGITRIVDEYS